MTATAVEVAQGRLVQVESGEGAPAQAEAPAGEGKTFRPYDPDQLLLVSPSIQDWVPEGDLAHFVSDLVDNVLDLAEIYASYEDERGYPPYDPRLMLKLLIYGYANGICSSRKLEQATYRDVAVRMLCAGQHPAYRSVARFRTRHLEPLAALFVQALRLCAEAGLVKLGRLALDGTKLRANASRHKAMSYERMTKAESELDAEIAELRARARTLLEEAEQVDAAEDERFGADSRGDELPEELARRETRLARLREAKRWRRRPASARSAAAPRWRPRVASRAPRRVAATPSPRSPPSSATSPIRSRRS